MTQHDHMISFVSRSQTIMKCYEMNWSMFTSNIRLMSPTRVIHTHAHTHCILSLHPLLMVYSEGYHSGWHLHVLQSPRRPLRGVSSTHKHKQTAQAHNKKQHLKAQDISWQSDDSLEVCNMDVVCLSLINTLMLLPWLICKQCRCFRRVSSGLTSYITARNTCVFLKDFGSQWAIRHSLNTLSIAKVKYSLMR